MHRHIVRTALLAALVLPAAAFAQSQMAFSKANPNASFLRCATPHPSEDEAKSIEERFHAMRAQSPAQSLVAVAAEAAKRRFRRARPSP